MKFTIAYVVIFAAAALSLGIALKTPAKAADSVKAIEAVKTHIEDRKKILDSL